MNRIHAFHAPATFAFRAQGLQVTLFLPDEEDPIADIGLSFSVLKGEKKSAPKKLRMLPIDGYVAEESFSLYGATIPAAALVEGETLTYSFRRGDTESETYTVPLFDIPTLPPLMLTEICTTASAPAAFLEFYNPTDAVVDLFDYDLLLYIDGELTGRDPLADARGVNLLGGGEVTAFRFISPALLSHARTSGLEKADFLADVAREHPEDCGDIAEYGIKLMQSTIVDRARAGAPTMKKGCFALPRDIRASYRFLIVPRGGAAETAVFSVTANESWPKAISGRAASHWCVDPRDPATGILAESMAHLTPGYFGAGEGGVVVGDVFPPAILPVAPDGRIYLSRGEIKVRFAAVGKTLARPTVYLKEGANYRAYPAKVGEDGIFEATVPTAALTSLRFDYYITVSGGLYTASLGTSEAPLSVRVVDDAGPRITACYPADGEALEDETCPTIRVAYEDISGVDLGASILCLDGKNISKDADFKENEVTYRPREVLAAGEHSVEVSLRDKRGNRTYRRMDFTTGERELFLYRGQLHSHTAASDGRGTPEEAMAYARDVAGLDFFAVSDHSQFFTPESYRDYASRAECYDESGRFVTLWGTEVTYTAKTGHWGHLDLLHAAWRALPEEDDIPSLYQKIAADPEAIGMFNHPIDAEGNFDEFAHDPRARENMCLVEIKGAAYDDAYALMLSRGWRAAPFFDEDNHAKGWGTTTRGAGVVLAASLTRENILRAIRRRRVYSTTDRTMEVSFRVNGAWLGSVLHDPEKLHVVADIHTKNEAGIGKVSLVGEDGIILKEFDVGARQNFSFGVDLDADFDYIYLKIVRGGDYTVTAPVFIERRDLFSIKEMKAGAGKEAAAPFAVGVTLQNKSVRPVANAALDLYLTPRRGFSLATCVPFDSIPLGTVEPGEERAVSVAFPHVAGECRVSAILRGQSGKKRLADTAYCLFSPVFISSLMPLTSPERGVSEPFSHLVIHNLTRRAYALDGHSLARRARPGKEPTEKERCPLDDITLPPNGFVVVWRRGAGNALTAQDFNARYGTALVEGRDLLITDAEILLTSDTGCRVDLLCGGELLCRVAYGRYCTKRGGVTVDRPILFAPSLSAGASETRLSPSVRAPALGQLAPQQTFKKIALPARATPKRAAPAKKETTKPPSGARVRLPSLSPRSSAFVAEAVSTVKKILKPKEK